MLGVGLGGAPRTPEGSCGPCGVPWPGWSSRPCARRTQESLGPRTAGFRAAGPQDWVSSPDVSPVSHTCSGRGLACSPNCFLEGKPFIWLHLPPTAQTPEQAALQAPAAGSQSDPGDSDLLSAQECGLPPSGLACGAGCGPGEGT